MNFDLWCLFTGPFFRLLIEKLSKGGLNSLSSCLARIRDGRGWSPPRPLYIYCPYRGNIFLCRLIPNSFIVKASSDLLFDLLHVKANQFSLERTEKISQSSPTFS